MQRTLVLLDSIALVNGLNALALAQGLQLGMRVSDVVRHLGA
jgi:hypothetical protein